MLKQWTRLRAEFTRNHRNQLGERTVRPPEKSLGNAVSLVGLEGPDAEN